MKTPKEILLQRHRAASSKLDLIRAEVVEAIVQPSAPQSLSWRDFIGSLRWHLAGWSAAWVVVMILDLDRSPGTAAMTAGEKAPPAQQIWASLRERRRLLLEDNQSPVVQSPFVPGRRSENEAKGTVV
jgi:hypothetical protein